MFAWLFLPVIMLLNYLLRSFVLFPLLGKEMAAPLSVAILLITIFAAAYFLLAGIEPPSSCRISLLLGAIWAGSALLFKVAFMLFSPGQGDIFLSFSSPGRGDMVVLAILFLAPLICSTTMLRR